MRSLRSEFPVSTLCRVLGVPRSTASYSARSTVPEDLTILKDAIQTFLVTYRCFGARRMYELLRTLSVASTRRQVRQAYLELGLLKKRPGPKVRTTNSNHDGPYFPNLVKSLVVERPDQVWVGDATYLRVGSRFAYLALLMDVCTRQIVGWSLESFLGVRLTLQALEVALATGRRPEIHHSDRDGAYASRQYVERLEACGAKSSMTAPDKPEENGYAERLNRTIKEEEAYQSDYRTVQEARNAMGEFVRYYNEKRIHSSLGYRTPSAIFREWLDQHRGRA